MGKHQELHLQGEYKMQDILSQEEKRMLTDFFELLNINMNKKQFYSFKKYKGKDRFCTSTYCISHIYNNYLPNARLFHNTRNCYFYINEGRLTTKLKGYWKLGKAITKQIESRKAIDRIAFNAFYFDFDIKNSAGEHLPLHQLQQEKAKLLPSLKNVPHTAIIESYNGFHLYLAIHPQDRHIKESTWRDIESQLLHYLFHNVSDYIDTSVKDPARILRIPSTYHKKSDSQLFKVQIVDLVHKQFTVEEIQRLFTLDFSNAYIPEKKVATNKVHQLSSTNEVIEAINNLDISFFREYIFTTSIYKTTKDRIDYIKSFDMLYFLQIDELTQDRFSSIFREDKHPSAFIDIVKVNGKPVYLYNDLGLHNFSKDIIELVKYIANISNKQAIKFLCDIFFSNNSITHTQQKPINDFINDNIQVLKILSSKSKQLNFISKLLPTYIAICDMLKEGIKTTNVPIKDYILEVGQAYISNKYNIPKSNVIQHIKLMYHLGIITKGEPLHLIQGKTPVNTCYLKDITQDKRISFIERSALNLKLHFPNVMKVTKKQLRDIELYW